mgnify:CR=1 FL=1
MKKLGCRMSPATGHPRGSEPRHLPETHEAKGLLQDVSCRNGFAVAIFSWGSVAFPQELEPKLRDLVGKQCAILRLDGYHFRAVD